MSDATPRAAVVVVGTELLRDGRPDTNGPWIERTLAREGIPTVMRFVVGDDRVEIASVLRLAMDRASIVVVSGGLGPTFDDLTREGTADALGRRLERRREVEDQIRERLHRRGIHPPESVYKMADAVEGSHVLRNPVGSAPGLHIEGPAHVFLVPGVPLEMEAMLREEVLPRLRVSHPAEPSPRVIFKIAGMFESEVESRLNPIMKSWRGVEATILASVGEVTFILRPAGAGMKPVEEAASQVRELLGPAIFSETDEGIEHAVGRLLASSRHTLAAAESCTGGMLGSMITSVAGSSAYFLGGVVSYADRVKEAWLGVPAEILERHGAVSAQTAQAMARGARERFGANLALAITGVAGPGGGTPEKPVGRVHVALAAPWGEEARDLNLPGDRATIRLRSCRLALDLLRRALQRETSPRATPPRAP